MKKREVGKKYIFLIDYYYGPIWNDAGERISFLDGKRAGLLLDDECVATESNEQLQWIIPAGTEMKIIGFDSENGHWANINGLTLQFIDLEHTKEFLKRAMDKNILRRLIWHD